jgi:carbonic anhydrase
MKAVDITYRYEARQEPARPQPRDADAARRRLDDGNRAFAGLLNGLADDGRAAHCVIPVDSRDLGLLPDDEKAPRQRPFAAVLGCSDARVPIELIFNEGPNDLFVVRVAGNGLGTDVLGSLAYAVENLGGSPKIVVVLGHSCCGAVSAAVDVFLEPARYLPLAASPPLRGIVDHLLVVVQASATRLLELMGPDVTRRPRYREALIEVSISVNAALAAYTLQEEIGRRDLGDLRTVYGIYLLETRQVWAPRPGGTPWSGLADPPTDRASFVDLGNAVVQSDRIVSLLDSR